ncbi:MAG: MurR/RpiR family transcriptional regulator [Coriobacteriales bacterium]|nr:MurR/RpiR family transcriptional regulator [Coriobacteriales bacterium]
MAGEPNKAVAFAHEASLGMPGVIKDIADYLLGEGTGVADLTMAQVASRAYTSKPSLVRYAKLAGYPGWPAYRHDFLLGMAQLEDEQVRRMDVDVNVPFTRDATAREMVDAISRTQRLACDEVQRSVDPQVLEAAAHTLVEARRIAYLGAMQNRRRGQIFASNLGLLGLLCHVPSSSESAALVRQFGKGDCAVAVSYSGDLMHQPFTLIPHLMELGMDVIAITNSKRSPLGAVATHTLSFAPLEHLHTKMGPFYSGACTSLILDMLYAACYARRYDASMRSREGILAELHGFIPEEL